MSKKDARLKAKEAYQRPLVNELVAEIKMVMAEGSSDGVPFARLSEEGKKELLSFVIDWTDYINRGLAIEDEKTYEGIDRIIENAVAGKPSENWMGRPEPLAERVEEMPNGQQRPKNLVKADLKEASQRLAKEKTKSPAVEKGKDKGIER